MIVKGKKVKVGGESYQIQFSDDPRTVDPDKEGQAQSLDGCVNYNQYIIGLHSKEPKVHIEQVFFHELSHAIAEKYHLTSLVDETGKHDEAAMDLMSMGLQEALSSLGLNILELLKAKK